MKTKKYFVIECLALQTLFAKYLTSDLQRILELLWLERTLHVICLKTGSASKLYQVAHSHIKLTSEYPQRWRLYNLPAYYSIWPCLQVLLPPVFLQFVSFAFHSFNRHLWASWLHLLYNLLLGSGNKVLCSLLLFGQRKPSSLSLSLYVMFSNPLAVLVALHWTCSYLGAQI